MRYAELRVFTDAYSLKIEMENERERNDECERNDEWAGATYSYFSRVYIGPFQVLQVGVVLRDWSPSGW